MRKPHLARWCIRFQWSQQGQRVKAVLPLLFGSLEAAESYMLSLKHFFQNLNQYRRVSACIERIYLKP